MNIEEFRSSEGVTAGENDNLKIAGKPFREPNNRHLPDLRDEKAVASISKMDFVKFVATGKKK